ncbi:MAG: rhodanese-like domain-containing protein [Alphaproteobacteria bacterium]
MTGRKTARTLSAAEVQRMLGDGGEMALIDVREQGVHYKGHPFWACCIPLSKLEFTAADLLPRRGARIVLFDGGEGLADRAAAKLISYGYTDVAVMAGGIAAWRDAGFELFSGVNVPSKAFGEFVEHEYETPRIDAAELKARQDAGEKLIILDSRPYPEYRRMSIPGGIDAPGAELVYRVHDLVPEPDTLVVVNCAGRTRSIIGAQSLINAGIPNKVVALKDGTMGWELAGFACERGQHRRAPAPSSDGLSKAQAAAAKVARRFGVQRCTWDHVRQWQADPDRTLYMLDVRTPEEFEAGHVHGARSAPGGQLVQSTDEYVAVRGARLVLMDDTLVRATMTASWLVQLGWPEVYVLDGGLMQLPQVQGGHDAHLFDPPVVDEIAAADLAAAVRSGAAVIDLDTSLKYRAAHIPGAYWAVRARLNEAKAKLPPGPSMLAFVGPSPIAAYAARDAAALWPGVAIKILRGGMKSWRRAELATETGMTRPTTSTDDVWYKPYDHLDNVEQAMRDYLSWEVNLVDQIKRDGTVRFKIFD